MGVGRAVLLGVLILVVCVAGAQDKPAVAKGPGVANHRGVW